MKKDTLKKVVLCASALLVLVFGIFLPKATWAYCVELLLSLVIIGILTFNASEKHNVAKVVLIAFVGFMILSWIIPAAYYSGEYAEQGRTQMGLFDMFNYPLTAVSYFGYITLFLILVGGFYGILHKIPAYRTFLEKIVTTRKGKYGFITCSYSLVVIGTLIIFAFTSLNAWVFLPELLILLVLAVAQFVIKTEENANKLLLSYLILMIALLVSVCGLNIGIAVFVPFIVALIFMMGYDKITAALVIVGSVSAGLIGSTFANSNLSVLTQALSLKLDYNIFVRLVILAAAIAIVIFNVLVYVKRSMSSVKVVKKEVKKAEAVVEVKKTKTTSSSSKKKPANKKTSNSKKTNKSTKKKNNNKAALKDDKVIVLTEAETVESVSEYVPSGSGKNHSVWPFRVLFILLFILVVLAFISWDAIGVKLFNNMTSSVTSFELFKFPIFAKLLGTVNAFGAWTLTDLFVPMALVIVLLAVIYKVSFDDILDGFVAGAKKALGAAVVSVLVYAVLVLVTYHPFQLVIYNTLLGLSKGFNILTTTIVAFLASLFNADIAYTFQSVLPYYVTKVTNLKDFSLVGIIFTSMYGLTSLVAPTSLVLLGSLAYLKVSYKDWLKAVWKLALELFVILLIVFIILALV